MLSWRCLFFETDLLMRPVSRRHCLDDRFLLSVHVGGYGLPKDFGKTAGHMFDVGCFLVASAPRDTRHSESAAKLPWRFSSTKEGSHSN